ncbi:recombinase-like helix-turn-helix domain-containing protein, partial [Paraburkholderia sp. SIMBA_050]
YENDLGDALERVFESGATELDDVVAGLNRIGFRAPDGTAWTPERFRAEMAALAE